MWPLKKAGIERRQYPRFPSSLLTDYNIGSEPINSIGVTKNISLGGICLNVYQRIKVGATLKLGIYLPDIAEPVAAIGKLVWTRETLGREYPFEAGIKFELFSPSFQTNIQNYINRIQNNRAT